MDSPSLNVLIVEDEPGHAAAILRAFKTSRPQDTLQVVGTLMECRNFLAGQTPDITITDIKLPDGSVFELLNTLAVSRTYPVIVMTSYGNETVAVEAMKAGALDYVVKSPESLNDMPHTVERVMREWGLVLEAKKAQDELIQSRSDLKAIYDGTSVMMCVIDENRRILSSNRAFIDVMQSVSPDKQQDRPCGCFGCVNALDDRLGCGYGPRCKACTLQVAMTDTLQTATPHTNVECELPLRLHGDELNVFLLCSVTPMATQQGAPRVLVSLLDITELKRIENESAEHLKELEQWYRATLNREDRVLELKNEINTLLEKLGEQPKYGKDQE